MGTGGELAAAKFQQQAGHENDDDDVRGREKMCLSWDGRGAAIDLELEPELDPEP